MLNKTGVVEENAQSLDFHPKALVDHIVHTALAQQERVPRHDVRRQAQPMDPILTLEEVSGVEGAIHVDRMVTPVMQADALTAGGWIRQ